MTRSRLVAIAFLAVIAAASLLRLTDLEAFVDPDKRLARVDLTTRAMHTDEAVHAIKFGALLEKGQYTYDPHEYHGPGLNYLTLPIAWAGDAETLVEVNETHLRLLPAILGIGLVGVLWLVRRDLGAGAALAAAVLTCLSPAMVFYSRYYIQEMLLVWFTFAGAAAMWRAYRAPAGPWQRARRIAWLVVAGSCTGMMHVSKETFVIAGFAATVGAIVVGLWHRKRDPDSSAPVGPKALLEAAAVVLVVAVVVSALFHSSFFKNPRGVVDSVLTYEHYVARAPGEGAGGNHEYPWYEYLHRLGWWQEGEGAVWTEGAIVVLALFGAGVAVAGKWLGSASLAVARFLAVYTLVLTVVYALIPYKTPWCMLGFLHGMILLAGVGAAAALRAAPCVYSKAMIAVVLAAAGGHLGYQAWRGSGPAREDPTNPYVYAHTTGEAITLADQVREFALAGGDGQVAPVQIICQDRDYWPLPWYLRDLPSGTVGYLNAVPSPSEGLAPIVVIQPGLTEALKDKMATAPPGQRHMYWPLPSPPVGEEYDWNWHPMLRPNVPLIGFITHDVWEAYRTKSVPVKQAGPRQVRRRTPREQTDRDVKALARQIRMIAGAGPDGRATTVQIICPDLDTSALSKYLGVMSKVACPKTVPPAGQPLAAIVVARADLENALVRRIGAEAGGRKRTHVPLPHPPAGPGEQYGGTWSPLLSPDVRLRAYVETGLWEAFLAKKNAPAAPDR